MTDQAKRYWKVMPGGKEYLPPGETGRVQGWTFAFENLLTGDVVTASVETTYPSTRADLGPFIKTILETETPPGRRLVIDSTGGVTTLDE